MHNGRPVTFTAKETINLGGGLILPAGSYDGELVFSFSQTHLERLRNLYRASIKLKRKQMAAFGYLPRSGASSICIGITPLVKAGMFVCEQYPDAGSTVSIDI